MQKRLIINPTPEQEGTYELLAGPKIKDDLFGRCLGNNPKYPLIIRGTQIGRMIGNIEYKIKSIQKWEGYEAKDREDACSYLNKVADEIYGPGWDLKVLKSEVMYGKAKVYGLFCPVEEKVQQMCEVLKTVATVEVNKAQTAKPTKTTNRSKKEKEETNE